MRDAKLEARKQALFETAIYLLLLADDGRETVKLKQAIGRLEAVIRIRESEQK